MTYSFRATAMERVEQVLGRLFGPEGRWMGRKAASPSPRADLPKDRHSRLMGMFSHGQQVQIWLSARHPGHQIEMWVKWAVLDPVTVVGVDVRLDGTSDPTASADALRAMRALGWPPSRQRSIAYLQPLWPGELSAHRRLKMIRRVEEALAG